jgi:hypothetical protein
MAREKNVVREIVLQAFKFQGDTVKIFFLYTHQFLVFKTTIVRIVPVTGIIKFFIAHRKMKILCRKRGVDTLYGCNYSTILCLSNILFHDDLNKTNQDAGFYFFCRYPQHQRDG